MLNVNKEEKGLLANNFRLTKIFCGYNSQAVPGTEWKRKARFSHTKSKKFDGVLNFFNSLHDLEFCDTFMADLRNKAGKSEKF